MHRFEFDPLNLYGIAARSLRREGLGARWVGLAGAVALIAVPAWAHTGPRVWIDNLGGQVVTFTSDNDHAPTIYSPARVFDSQVLDVGGIFQNSFPGYEVRRADAQVGPGTTFGFNIAGPLLFYDSDAGIYQSTRATFGPPSPGPVPQMAVSLDEAFRETEDRQVSGFDFFTYFATGDHAHLSYTLLPVDPPFNPPTGIYALPMTLAATGLAASDPYFILLGKGVAPGSPLFEEAHGVMQAMLDFPADTNFDSRIDKTDLTALARHWQQPGTWADGDFNFDSFVDARDLFILAQHWKLGVDALDSALHGAGLPLAAVPEPSAALLIAAAMLTLRRRRPPTGQARHAGYTPPRFSRRSK